MSLLQWILENREWLFSGAGVTILLLIGGYLLHRFRGRQSSAPVQQADTLAAVLQAAPPPPPVLPDTRSITPRQIRETINETPVLLQPDIIRQYAGITVSWEGTLLGATKTGPDSLRIWLQEDYSTIGGIVFDIAPSAYPGLGLLRKGAPVKVRGVIKSVETIFIELRDAVMEFNP